MKTSLCVFAWSVASAVLSVAAVVAVIKLLVVPQLGVTTSAVALCTIRHVHVDASRDCVRVTVAYMTTDGTHARGYILPPPPPPQASSSSRTLTRNETKCFCSDCSHQHPDSPDLAVLQLDEERFQVGQTALCLKHLDSEILTLHRNASSAGLKCAILLPSLMFIVAFVSCFISAIRICKDQQLAQEKARRMARQSTLTRLSRRL